MGGTTSGLIGGTLVVWFFPIRVRSMPHGTIVTAEGQPELFARVTKAALSAGLAVPDEVYLTQSVGVEVRQMGGFAGFGGKTVLEIGLPLLYFLNVSEFDAVLMHAFAHIGRSMPLSSWLFRAHSRMSEISVEEWRDWMFGIFPSAYVWYARVFVRMTQPAIRIQTREADEIAAKVAGSDTYVHALKVIDQHARPFHTFLCRDVYRAVKDGYHPSMMEGYRLFRESGNGEFEEQSWNPQDTNLPLDERVRAIEQLPAGKGADETPAIALLRDAWLCERLMLCFSIMYSEKKLTPIRWKDVTDWVIIPGWYETCRYFGGRLSNFTLSDLPAITADLKAFEKAADLPVTPWRPWSPQWSKDLLTAALGTALRGAGWRIQYSPGYIRLRRGAATIDPRQVVEELSASKLSALEWQDMLERYELNPSMPLAVA
jgi:hypothetical protein